VADRPVKTSACGRPVAPQGLDVARYRCPWCAGTGSWTSGERCLECAGSGQTDERTAGVDLSREYDGQSLDDVPTVQPAALPRPPGVMLAPCRDCAFRPGSPEALGEVPLEQLDQPFHCHHGLLRIDTPEGGAGYMAPVYWNGAPVGAFVCAGWWAARVWGKPLPRVAFTDPGGADRSSAAPRLP
jgi:hypothetical protein